MKEKLVSIIVPIYNSEQDLDRCISSIVNQTYKKLQIILVNDGSSDRSGLICDKWKEKEDRIQVYHKKNSGVSSARNKALMKASGFYITFIDSDDYIDSNYIEDMMKIALENDFPDIIKSQSVKESKKYKNFSHNLYCGLLDFHQDFDKLAEMFVQKHEFGSVCSSLFKNETIKKIKFKEEYSYGEDYLYYFTCLMKAKKIYITDKTYYHYVINENSLTHKFDSHKMMKKIIDHYRIDLILDHYFLEKKELKYIKGLLECTYNSTKGWCTQIATEYSYKQYIRMMNELFQLKEYKDFLKINKKYGNFNIQSYASYTCYIKLKIYGKMKKLIKQFLK